MHIAMKTQKIWCVRIVQKDLGEKLITDLTQRQAILRANKITCQCIEPWDVVTWGLPARLPVMPALFDDELVTMYELSESTQLEAVLREWIKAGFCRKIGDWTDRSGNTGGSGPAKCGATV